MSSVRQFDLEQSTVREVNQFLHGELPALVNGAADRIATVEILNPAGRHSIAAGLDCPVDVEIRGHAGYFIGGMNKQARITVHGNVGWSVGENIMSGSVRVVGHASECAAASAHGGLVVIEGDTSSRCAISLKGGDVVVAGGVGHFSAFMAQAGRLVICGDAGAHLGDSLYEAVIYVAGSITSLGADAREEPMQDDDRTVVAGLLEAAGVDRPAGDFRRIASARTLYHWNADARQEY